MQKWFRGFAALSVNLLLLSCSQNDKLSVRELPAPSNIIDGVAHEIGNWQTDLPAGEAGTSLGNHRVVLRVAENSGDVWAHIPWRRSDPEPQNKRLVLVSAQSGEEIKNKAIVAIDRYTLDLIFQPKSGQTDYFLYYLPYETNGGYYPSVTFLSPQESAQPAWRETLGELSEARKTDFAAAEVLRIEAIDAFHSIVPMEIVATPQEVKALQDSVPQPFYLFPETRENPIRMRRFLPKHWLERGLLTRLPMVAKKGEYYAFQIGLFAAQQPLDALAVQFEPLVANNGKKLENVLFESINTGGIDLNGVPFSKSVSVEKGEVQPLWIGIAVPEEAEPDVYTSKVVVGAQGLPSQSISLELAIEDEVIEAHGDNEPQNMSRLHWLNSTIGTDPDFIMPPFEPISVDGKNLHILGRRIVLAPNGLPAQIESFFNQEMTRLNEQPEPVLVQPAQFIVHSKAGDQKWQSSDFDIVQPNPGRATWFAESESQDFSMRVRGSLEYEGMLDYQIEFVAKSNADIDDIVMQFPLAAEAAKYVLGLGLKGQRLPANIDWKWDQTNHHEGAWLGAVNKGLQFVLRDRNYERPLNTNFYQAKPLNLPPSWYNEGKGGIRIERKADKVMVQNYSGARTLQQGDTLHFYTRFLLTPFKLLDTKTHFNTRFVHKYVPVDSVKAWGGTVVNIHHANEINPYINYPFYNLDKQSQYIEEAHRKGIKVKLYDTIRELTYKCYELFALRSLGDEILNDGEGGGHPWLQEHLQDHYHKGWHAWRVDDAAILNKGTSRWTNYYIEGLNWLAKNQKIDGLYLDDIAFSRETVKRMVSVFYQHRDEVVIDLHSANQFNERDGFINSAFLYMEHFPFVSRLWFGEYFDYNQRQDYWLTEVSGIPFGLMGEMLQDGGHPYRGMLYGMTTRLYGDFDPRPIWTLFDDFGIAESRMIGYWVKPNPVRTNLPGIIATSYILPEKTLIALASWESQDREVTLQIDWQALGLAGDNNTRLHIPRVEGLQEEADLPAGSAVTVPAEQGLFVILEQK